MFLPGPFCSNCAGHRIYHPNQSSTAKDLESFGVIIYGEGQVEGELFTDDVFLGGLEVSACWFQVGSLTGN
jgi:hypothetical protein